MIGKISRGPNVSQSHRGRAN